MGGTAGVGSVNALGKGRIGVALATACVAVLLAVAGCSNTPEFSAERQQVRAIQHNNAVAEQASHPSAVAPQVTARRSRGLGEDDYRAIRYAIAKPVVTPSDAAKLPFGSSAVLMRYLHNPRFRRYGPAIVTLIGMIGDEKETAFLRDYLENEVRGGVDEYGYRTLVAVPVALGYLAIHNDHAYAALRDYLRLQFWRENIQWRFAAKDRDMNAYRMVMASLEGISISGRRTATPYVEYIIEHECGTEGGRLAATRTLMDERLEAQARQTVAALGVAE